MARVLAMPHNLRPAAESIRCNSAVGWLNSLLEDAIAHRRVSGKQAAYAMGMDPGYFSRARREHGPALGHLEKLPADVIDEFAALLAEARGLHVRRRNARELRTKRIADLHRELLVLMDEDALDSAAGGTA